MEVIRKTLLDVIAWDSESGFIIPRWQRHYVWGNGEVKQLWTDWCIDCDNGIKHFCGVMLFRKVGEAPLRWEIVDGQQRMTTFFIFFIALRDVCREQGIDFSELSGVFTLEGSNECRLVLQAGGVTEDREILNGLLNRDTDSVEKDVLEKSAIYNAYKVFKTNLSSKTPEDIAPFVLKILQNLDIVVLTVDDTDDTRRIFEALNSRGKQVDPDELVLNLITYIGEDLELNEYAKSIWDFISGLLDEDGLADFLEAFANRNGKQSERGTVFEEIRFEVEAAKKANRVRDWLKEFKRAAHNYNEILFPEESDDKVEQLLSELKRLRVTKLNPFLLALLEAFRNTSASEPLMHNLVAAIVRLFITLERPGYRIDKFSEEACLAFYDEKLAPSDRLEKVITLIDSIWISDEDFKKAFVSKSVYAPGAHLSRLRYYLEKLEQKIGMTKDTPFEMHFGANTTVEHIMPQTLDKIGRWKSALRITDPIRLEMQHKALVHTIGNLTVLLAEKNPEASNAPYADKREFYLHPNEVLNKMALRRRKIVVGNCALNQYFEDVPSWNFQTIVDRSNYLADLALQIWNKQDWNREI